MLRAFTGIKLIASLTNLTRRNLQLLMPPRTLFKIQNILS